MGIAGYMKMIVDLGDAVDAETRETLRLELLAKSKDALASAEKIDDDAKRKEAVDRLKRSLKKLDAGPMKGPIVDNTGKEVLKKGDVADDKFLGGLNFYVKGVEGKVPGGDKK